MMESLEKAIVREFREETGYTVHEFKNIGVCDFFVLWTLKENTVEHLHHIAILYETKVDSEELISSIETFGGQDSNGATWLPIKDVTPDNSSPLVLQAIDWISSRTLSVATGSFD